MDIGLSKEQIKMQDEVKAFVDSEVAPFADQNDREEKIESAVIKKIADRGYLASMIPKEYGGMEMDMMTIGILNEEFGRVCSSTKALLTVHGMVAIGILRWGTQEQKNYYLPKLARGEIIGAFGLSEPEVGSDAKSIQTTAIQDNKSYILNGKKRWITMGQIADLFLVFAQCNEKPTAFIIERNTPGFSTVPITGLMGARASMLAELNMEDCKIPQENMLGEIGWGLSHVCQSSLDYGRYTIAWGCVGLCQACLDASLQYARKRKQFGTHIRSNQLIQKMISEMVVNIKAARLLCYNAAYLKETGNPDSIMETWNAKYFASILANKVASDAIQIHGANGCHSNYPIERYYRDARINEIIEGTTQMHEVMIAINAFRSI